jgi:hypothetical protein
MSGLEVIVITNGEESEKEKVCLPATYERSYSNLIKVLLFDPKEGRASKRQLCMYP